MQTPKMGLYKEQSQLETRILATEGTGELLAFAFLCGYPKPVFSCKGSYREHIRVSSRQLVILIRKKGAVEVSEKKFNKLLLEKKEAERKRTESLPGINPFGKGKR